MAIIIRSIRDLKLQYLLALSAADGKEPSLGVARDEPSVRVNRPEPPMLESMEDFQMDQRRRAESKGFIIDRRGRMRMVNGR